jgi:hypothetical protein
VSGGTRRNELLDMFPLLVKAKIFAKRRRRRCSQAGSFQRIFGFLFILAVLSLGGFRCSSNKNILNRSSLWKGRARNKELMILEEKLVQSYKKNSDKVKEDE